MPIEVQEAFETRYGIAVLPSYGATEFAGGVAGWTLPLHREWGVTKRGSVGRPQPGRELRVVDPETGSECATGTSGQLEVRSRDGEWVRTTDVARIDDDGFVWIEGRSDDAIVRGGFKVFPNEIADVLRAHPAVLDAGVTGIDDERLGAVPVAAVELREGATDHGGRPLRVPPRTSPELQGPDLAARRRIAPPHSVAEGESARPAGALRCGDRPMSHPLRGAVAIVGVADEVSPTGEIDLPLRTLEARVVARRAR